MLISGTSRGFTGLSTIMPALCSAALGVHAYLRTSIEAFPDVTNVQVNVIAQLPGLAPEEIERQVTVPLERALNGLPGMIQMRSESLFGLSLIFITFEDGADSFQTRARVTERMTAAELPPGVQPVLGPDDTPLGVGERADAREDRRQATLSPG